MSYAFRDVTEAGTDSYVMPEEVQFNGNWLYQVVPGFRTLNVEGRELFSQKLETYEVAERTYYRRKIYPERIIKVTYQIIANSDEAFRESYNLLNYYLKAEQARLIFYDEQDKYFIATKVENDEVEAGRNKVTGVIGFTCTDPRKYAVAEKSFEAATDSNGNLAISVLNNGTEDVPIDYVATVNASEDGFIGFTSQEGALQYGLIEDADGEHRAHSVTMLDCASGSEIISNSTAADSSGLEFVRQGSVSNGSMDGSTANWMKPSSFGTRANNVWQGPAMTAAITASANVRAIAFCAFNTAKMAAMGLVCMSLNDANGSLANVFLVKATNTHQGVAYIRVRGLRNPMSVNFSAMNDMYTNPFYQGAGTGNYLSIKKSGGDFLFNIAGTTRIVKGTGLTTDLTNSEVTSVTLWSCAYGNYTAMEYMGFRSLQVISDNVVYYHDIPNRYQNGDVIEVNGTEGKMYLTRNGTKQVSQEDEIIGSVHFKAKAKDTTKIIVSHSDWASADPTVIAYIREAWL